MPSERRGVFIRTADGHKSYAVKLDPQLSTGDWESRILQQGFHEPDTGLSIPAHAIQAVAVRDEGMKMPPGFDSPKVNLNETGSAPVDWLLDQVQEICALGLQ